MAKIDRIASPGNVDDSPLRGRDCEAAMRNAMQSLALRAASSGWTEDEVAYALLHDAGHRIMRLMADRQVRDAARNDN